VSTVVGQAAEIFRTFDVTLIAFDDQNRPVPGARVRAYAEDQDILIPVRSFVTANAKGLARLPLPPGHYTLVAAGRIDTSVLLLQTRVRVTKDVSVRLRATHRHAWKVLGATPKTRVREMELAPRSLPFLRLTFPVTASAGTLLTDRVNTPHTVLSGSMDNRNQFVLAGRTGADGIAFACSPARTACVLWSSPIGEVSRLLLDVRTGPDDPFGRQIALVRNAALRISRGTGDLSYSYTHPGVGDVQFARLAFEFRPQKPLTLRVGGPLVASVWHESFQRRPRKGGEDCYQVHLFLRDANGHRLLGTAAGRRSGARTAKQASVPPRRRSCIPATIQILRGQRILQTVASPRSFTCEFEKLLIKEQLAARRYRVTSGLLAEPVVVRGRTAASFTQGRYGITAPAELAAEARCFLTAANTLYDAMRKITGSRPRWGKGRIRIRAAMPPSVRASAGGGGGSNFTIRDLMKCVTVRDALIETPIMHEFLHTFRFKHADYMNLTGFRVRRSLDPQGFRSMGHVQDNHAELVDAYLKSGKGREKHATHAMARILLERHGPEVFDRYHKRSGTRDAMVARGDSEALVNCILLSRLAGENLAWLFNSVGANIDPRRIAREM
jgi:hypothetical protein